MSYWDELRDLLERSPMQANALVFAWLCDDDHRAALYADLRERQPVLKLQSCAKDQARATQPVYLLTRKDDIEHALAHYSNAPYRPIGSGSFVLALDGDQHHEKRRQLGRAMATRPEEVSRLAMIAVRHALVGPTKIRDIDVVAIAEQAALRFVTAWFGFEDKDHILLEDATRPAHDGMIWQMFARHFVLPAGQLDKGVTAMGAIVNRIAELLTQATRIQSTTRLMRIIAADEAGMRQTVASTLKAVREAHAALPIAQSIDAFSHEASGYVQRLSKLLSELLNYAVVRRELPALIEQAARADATLVAELRVFVEDLIAQKEAPEDRLSPRRFVLRNGEREVPRPDEVLGDLWFRETVIERAARNTDAGALGSGDNTIGDLAVAMLGTIAGLMGNVIAGASITLNRFFKLTQAQRDRFIEIATPKDARDPAQVIACAASLEPLVRESLRLEPPAAFIPRRTPDGATIKLPSGAVIPAGAEVLIPLGAATRDVNEQPDEFDEGRGAAASVHVFGHPSSADVSHRCLGDFIALPLINQIVRSLITLPGLEEITDERGDAVRLRKRWGYICEKYPLTYDRPARLIQQPLNVVMKLKQPTAISVAALRRIISTGAPAIEHVLAESKLVHFARFVLLNNDTELGLFTAYDGAFEDYVGHFADVAGPVFDALFAHIEDPPPMPVRERQAEFIEHIRRYNRAPVGDYFFSVDPMRRAT